MRFLRTSAGYIVEKDPDAELDYKLDWSKWLASGDTINASTWSAATGITQISSAYDTTSTTVWLSGGTAGEEYEVTCEIETAGGRTENQSFTVVVTER